MEERGIDLRKYQPPRVSRQYIVKVTLYALVLVVLIWFIQKKLDERSVKAEQSIIRGVRIEH